MHANDYYKKFTNKIGLKHVLESYNKLQQNYDIIIIEGAGSPAEINLQRYDISNMKIAEKTNSPVVLITDIERGGSFASLVGTLELLEKKHQNLIKGFVINNYKKKLVYLSDIRINLKGKK